MSKGEEMFAVRAGCAPLEPLQPASAVGCQPAVVRLVADRQHRAAVVVGHDHEPALVEPSCKEEWTLSDPGRFGRQTPCPRFCGGRESYGPGRGRSGYFNRFGG